MKIKSLFVGLLFILLFHVLGAFAQNNEPFENPTYTQEFIDEQELILENIETYFPRILINNSLKVFQGNNMQDFEEYRIVSGDSKEGYYLGFQGKEPVKKEFGIGPNFFYSTGSYENFYIHVDVKLFRQDSSMKGFFSLQYTDSMIVGEDKRCSVEIKYPWCIEKYKTRLGERKYTTLYELKGYENDYNWHTLEMIRLNGYTSAFVDRHFIVGFEDEFDGRFSHQINVGVKAGGQLAEYDFKNLILRRQ